MMTATGELLLQPPKFIPSTTRQLPIQERRQQQRRQRPQQPALIMLFAASFVLAAAAGAAVTATAFLPTAVTRRTTFGTATKGSNTALWMSSRTRNPSRVSDPSGPTEPARDEEPLEMVDPDDVPGLKDVRTSDELPHPIPHQPWRRGDTAGCEAPISAPWRREAESIIKSSVECCGGRVLDVTWYLTSVVVTLDEDARPPQDFLKADGPVIDIVEPREPRYYDPEDPKPDQIWDEEEDVLYQRETEEERKEAMQRRDNMWATKDIDDDPNEPHVADRITLDGSSVKMSKGEYNKREDEEDENDDDDGEAPPLYMNEETRDDVVLAEAEEALAASEEAQEPMDVETITIDTAALSIIAKSIIDGLEDVEDELQILSRHELILSSPGAPDVLETQRQFDAYRGAEVAVETVDPFDSNRVLHGALMDRNAMDVMINKKGRMVTIPLNFVKCVRLMDDRFKVTDE